MLTKVSEQLKARLQIGIFEAEEELAFTEDKPFSSIGGEIVGRNKWFTGYSPQLSELELPQTTDNSC